MIVIFSNASILNLFVSLITVLAITLVFKTSTTTNFAQTTIATFGGYLVAKLGYEHNINIWVSLIIGLVVCLLMGLFIDTCIIRRAKAANAVSKQIITMGFTYVLLSLISVVMQIHEADGSLIQQNPATVFLPLTNTVDSSAYGFKIGNVTYYWNTLICVGMAAILIAVFFILVYKTKFGLGVRMTASNETTAQMMGVNTHLITAFSWSFATMLGCFACVFLNNTTGALNTSIMTSVQLLAFLACVVGGFNTFWGPAVATVIIWLLGALVNLLGSVPAISDITMWKDVIVYGIAMILVLIKPSGLFGKAVRKKV